LVNDPDVRERLPTAVVPKVSTTTASIEVEEAVIVANTSKELLISPADVAKRTIAEFKLSSCETRRAEGSAPMFPEANLANEFDKLPAGSQTFSEYLLSCVMYGDAAGIGAGPVNAPPASTSTTKNQQKETGLRLEAEMGLGVDCWVLMLAALSLKIETLCNPFSCPKTRVKSA
jgi:hypothetical protein